MQSLGKLRGANLFETSNSEMKAKEQEKSERKGQEALDNLIRKTIGKESLLSFSKSGENPAQLMHLLHAFDQQSGNKLSRGSTFELGMDSKDEQNGDASTFLTASSSGKEFLHSNMKDSGSFGKGLQNPTENMHSLKFPEAVVAIAQAAAKVNGEPEKYLPGWPLLSKVQMLKCEKCSREFISPLNHRRHVRVHRRRLNLEKDDSQKKRANLAEFWDKLSVDEAKQILSLKNIMLEEVPGSSIVNAMSSFTCKPGLLSLPQFYVKAGATLLDLVQLKSSRFPLSAEQLFSILDDASEKTFLCPGKASSVHKFVFAGEAGKVSLEVRNVVASMGFLVEQKLENAWLVDKDAEALRCQKLLFEEEEAAQKKRAEQLERKRLKKLRQKELKEKEQAANMEYVDSGLSSPEVGEGESLTAAISSPSSVFSEDASPRLSPAASCSDLYKDASSVGENGMVHSADQIVSPDADLESRASQDSMTGVPVYPELDYANHQGQLQDKNYADCNVRSWREHVSQKHVSGNRSHQTLLKSSRKSYNVRTSRQGSSNAMLGQRFGPSNKSLGQRTSGVNGFRIWTKKALQSSRPDADKGPKSEGTPKDAMDVCKVKLGDTLHFSSDVTCNGLICEGARMSVEEGFGNKAETNKKLELKNVMKANASNGESDSSHLSNSKASGGELLIGSMSLCLDSFPNDVSRPSLVHGEGKLWDDSTDGKNCNSISNYFDSFSEFARVSNCGGPLHPNNSCDKADRCYVDAPSESDWPERCNGEASHGTSFKQGSWPDGPSKSGTKIWRPVSCGEGYVTECSVNSRHIEDNLTSDSKSRATVNATAGSSSKHEKNASENLDHSKEDICSSDAHHEQKVDPYQSEKEFEESIYRIFGNDGAQKSYECHNYKQNDAVETIDQRETKFWSACDAAAAFLSQRWEGAVMSSETEVLECVDSGPDEWPSSHMAFVGSELKQHVLGTVSESHCLPSGSFQSKDESVTSIEAIQGRQKTFNCGFGTVPHRPSSVHCTQTVEVQKMGKGADSRKLSGLKPEKGHLKYMPRRRK